MIYVFKFVFQCPVQKVLHFVFSQSKNIKTCFLETEHFKLFILFYFLVSKVFKSYLKSIKSFEFLNEPSPLRSWFKVEKGCSLFNLILSFMFEIIENWFETFFFLSKFERSKFSIPWRNFIWSYRREILHHRVLRSLRPRHEFLLLFLCFFFLDKRWVRIIIFTCFSFGMGLHSWLRKITFGEIGIYLLAWELLYLFSLHILVTFLSVRRSCYYIYRFRRLFQKVTSSIKSRIITWVLGLIFLRLIVDRIYSTPERLSKSKLLRTRFFSFRSAKRLLTSLFRWKELIFVNRCYFSLISRSSFSLRLYTSLSLNNSPYYFLPTTLFSRF